VIDWLDMGEETKCPVLFYAEFNHVFSAYKYHKEGILPHSGGWADQPANLMAFVEIIKSRESQ